MSFLLLFLLVMAGSFVCSRLALYATEKGRFSLIFMRFGLDIWVGMWLFLCIGWLGVHFLLPDNQDVLTPLGNLQIVAWFLFAAAIYAFDLIDNDILTRCTVSVLSGLVVLLFPSESEIFGQGYPFWVDRALGAAMMILLTYALPLLNGISTILSLQMLAFSLGGVIISVLGGLPIYWGLMCAFAFGLWAAYLQANVYAEQLPLSSSACLSIGFLFGCLSLEGCAELAAPSLWILWAYPMAEFLWMFVSRYLLRQRESEFYENCGYWSLLSKGVEPAALLLGISKILLINLLLAFFQLYAPNPYSLPMFALVADLWFLYTMHRVSSPSKTFREINGELIQTIKDSFKMPNSKE
jgi:UDP-N-acetylmuramyl pentapeptide phosphotransferase/UDP-N-acetylglucosamine-1-phosphate transferase